MPLAAGIRFGPYEITAPLGAGGMGEVYRGRDTRLDRTVAIKVLPAHVAHDPDFRERFTREARVISSLEHAHICALYDVGEHDGTHFLVMQYLEGETLAERLKKGPLPIEQVLRHAIEIAEALDAAHRRGIVHRDLKPGNVMLTRSGAKLLDFGLAKHAAPGVADGATGLPTRSELTAQGTILGTLQYMAPEQLEGREADARTDLFAFGAVVHEMATGRKAFAGTSQASVIAAILERHPPAIATLQPMTPQGLDHIVQRCLRKDPEERWQSAYDVASELRWIGETGRDGHPESGTRLAAPRRPRAALLAAALVSGLVIGAAVSAALWRWSGEQAAPGPAIVRAVVPLPNLQLVASRSGVAIARDGRHLAFVITVGGSTQIATRAIDEFELKPVSGTTGGSGPFFSPDGAWLGFVAGGRLMKVPRDGGTPVTLCEVGDLRGAVWFDDTIIFSPRLDAGLFRVSAGGGTPEPLTAPDPERREKSHRFPTVLTGGRAVMYTMATHDIASFTEADIVVQPLDGGPPKPIIRGGTAAKYVASGHVVYARDGVLTAVPFDLDRLEVTGPPVAVAEGVAHAMDFGRVEYDVSDTGTLVFLPGGNTSIHTRMQWVERSGRSEPVTSQTRLFLNVNISPDGQKILAKVGGANDSAWIYDIRRDALSRLTFRGNLASATWTADGQRVLYNLAGQLGLIAADGSGIDEPFFSDPAPKASARLAPDGDTVIVRSTQPKTGNDIWIGSVRSRTAKPWLATEFNEDTPRLSPDGRWVAYVSNETGRFEVYMRPLQGAGKTQISRAGGYGPVWSADGRELFFLQPETLQELTMMAATVHVGPRFEVDRPAALFGWPDSRMGYTDQFDVTPDGKRFVILAPVQTLTPDRAHVVVGWEEEIRAEQDRR